VAFLQERSAELLAPRSVEDLWATIGLAAGFDETLKIDRKSFPRMLKRFVAPMPFSREALFGRMLAAEPSVLRGFPVPARGPIFNLSATEAGPAIMEWLAKRRSQEKHRIFAGPKGVRREVTLHDLARKWRARRTSIGVTDLHIRETVMEEIIDPDALSAFNILCGSSPGARAQEMFSFVISSRGYVTDSHSDAPDSTNFCFVGQKLWLAWDTYEGLRRGLQDVERVRVLNQAKFDMETWLSLRSARWFLVNPSDTLFLPANLTHKVITIEPYIGVGGFFIALPNCLRVLSHWIIRGPLWSKKDATGHSDDLIMDVAESIRNVILNAPQNECLKWGYDYLEESARFFIKSCPTERLRSLWSDPRFRCVADVVSVPWPFSASRGRMRYQVQNLNSGP
jgi:hypothetical protein